MAGVVPDEEESEALGDWFRPFRDLPSTGSSDTAISDVRQLGQMYRQDPSLFQRWKYPKEWLAYAYVQLGLPATRAESDEYLVHPWISDDPSDLVYEGSESSETCERNETQNTGSAGSVVLQTMESWPSCQAKASAMPGRQRTVAQGPSPYHRRRIFSSPDLASLESRVSWRDRVAPW